MRLSLSIMILAFVLAGCGSDFVPPTLETTGRPASPLGQVIDLEVSLPEVRTMESPFAGVQFEMRLELERSGFGEIPARAFYVGDRVEDLSDGQTLVTVTPERWLSGRLGPVRIDGALFSFLLDGSSADGGWTLSGDSLESQGAGRGSFQGWRRHRFLIATTDFLSSAGRVAEVALIKDRHLQIRDGLELISADPVLRASGGAVFAVNRFTFDNLQRLDPQSDYATAWQRSMGIGSNPHDLLIIDDDKGYVTRYEPPFDDIAVFDPAQGQIMDTIPLGPLADNVDGTPRADRIVRVGDTAFVGLQNIDRSFTAFGEARLAVIDTVLDEVTGEIPLGGKNVGEIQVWTTDDGRQQLYVALAGVFPGLNPQELSGGVVVVDTVNRAVERMALDDDDAGGNIAGLALASDELAYAIVSDEQFANRVIAFDPATGEVARTLVTSEFFLPEIALDTGAVLAIPDRSPFQPRLCLHRVPTDTAGIETAIGCVDLTLPPAALEALD